MEDRRRAARLALAALDLTRLEDDADDAEVRALCRRAATPHGQPAAVCVYPRFIAAATEELRKEGIEGQVRIATVANFPQGDADAGRAADESERAVDAGADEVDVVFPWRALADGDETAGAELVRRCRAATAGRRLKVILESGMLGDSGLISRASRIAIDSGADFIKTSTGKAPVNATPEGATAMLEAIRDSGTDCGFKVSGGVRTLDDAIAYMTLAERILGSGCIEPGRFRIGASGLLAVLLDILDAEA